MGRPNVGKSTLLNQLIGHERVLTGPEAGVTRDSIGIEWEYKDHPYTSRRYGGAAKAGESHGKAGMACDF